MTVVERAEVAIVGGGPAGAALAIRLASAGRATVVFERQPQQRWRASGVYSSPLTRRQLARLGVPPDELDRLLWPITATAIQTTDGGSHCVLDHLPQPACGVDRVRLEEALLGRAREAGADVQEGATVLGVELSGRRGEQRLSVTQGGRRTVWAARIVVGADGPTSIVARTAGVARAVRHLRRAGVTGHRASPARLSDRSRATIVVGGGWYLGIAPVPDGRVNLGLVMGERELRRQLAQRASLDAVMDDALAQVPESGADWRAASATDELRARLPLSRRVSAAAGPGFVLVGDAAGFIDPLSGEGLHRALVSAELAERAVVRSLSGDPGALNDYDQRLRARFRSKDLVSWLLQAFLFRPALTAYALERLSRRVQLRRALADTLGDLAPGSTVIDPRFLARLLAP